MSDIIELPHCEEEWRPESPLFTYKFVGLEKARENIMAMSEAHNRRVEAARKRGSKAVAFEAIHAAKWKLAHKMISR
jgi:hypothetical protein